MRYRFLFCLLLLWDGYAFAADSGTSAMIGATTDYVWRGRSESRHQPALQGEFDWWDGSDYAGLWVSSVDFGDKTTFVEIDPYAGTSFDLGGVSLVLGLGASIYPVQPAHADDNDVEAKIGVKRDWGEGSLAIAAYQRVDQLTSHYYEAIGTCDLDPAWRASLALADHVGGVGYVQATATLQYAVDDHLCLLLSYSATNHPQVDDSYRPALALSLRVGL